MVSMHNKRTHLGHPIECRKLKLKEGATTTDGNSPSIDEVKKQKMTGGCEDKVQGVRLTPCPYFVEVVDNLPR